MTPQSDGFRESGAWEFERIIERRKGDEAEGETLPNICERADRCREVASGVQRWREALLTSLCLIGFVILF